MSWAAEALIFSAKFMRFDVPVWNARGVGGTFTHPPLPSVSRASAEGLGSCMKLQVQRGRLVPVEHSRPDAEPCRTLPQPHVPPLGRAACDWGVRRWSAG
jgi:hypothetical protein